MKRAWRIVKKAHAATAFSGEGARRFGGRWNSPGTPVVYTSGTLALAALEILVHLNPPVRLEYVAIPFDFEDAWVQKLKLSDLPADWMEEPPPPSTQLLGDRWVKQARSAILELPSTIVRIEPNYLLNAAHPDFRKVRIGKAMPFAFDPRLL